jgi:hypothetical protein
MLSVDRRLPAADDDDAVFAHACRHPCCAQPDKDTLHQEQQLCCLLQLCQGTQVQRLQERLPAEQQQQLLW